MQPIRGYRNCLGGKGMHLHVHLKICEGCGSLWYRASDALMVYCNACAVKLGEFPSPRTRRRPGGRRKVQVKTGMPVVAMAGGSR